MNTLTSPLSISVIVPVYNGGDLFRRCLVSLAKAMPAPYEVIVVSDGDTDGSWLLAQEFGVKVIKLPHCQGPARARNVGAKAAKGEVLFFVDADVEIYPETILAVAEAFQQNPHLSALIGSYDDQPGSNSFLSQYRNLFHHYTHQNSCPEASTFWGACGAIRRDVFWSVGGFDERYRYPSIEDIELGYRLKRTGHKIGLFRDIQVKHLKHWGFISLLRADFFYRALPWTKLILQNGKMINDLNLQWSSRLSVVLVYALLGSCLGACWSSYALFLVLVAIWALLMINAPVYEFFEAKRGFKFALQSIPCHWLYYFYSGLAFALGTIRHWIDQYQVSRSSYQLFKKLMLQVLVRA